MVSWLWCLMCGPQKQDRMDELGRGEAGGARKPGGSARGRRQTAEGGSEGEGPLGGREEKKSATPHKVEFACNCC